MTMNIKNVGIYISLIIGGLIVGYLIFGGSPQEQTMEEHVEETHARTGEDGETLYTCSMHPQVRETEPGNCPICGMELIPLKDSDEASLEENEHRLTMTEAAVKLAEIQTSPVVKENPVSTVRLPGKVVENRNNVSSVTAHFPGRVKELYVDFAGAYVSKGQKLASIYSPELIAAQQELLETMRVKDQNPALYEAAKRKLELWEFPETTIEQIEQSGEVMNELDFFSPVSGYVSEIAISREDHVTEGALMYTITNLSSVWVDFQSYESSISTIGKGDKIEFNVASIPGEVFESTVIFIDPYLENNSRTVTVRTQVENPEGTLKPGMFAEAEVKSSTADEAEILIPKSAVMWTGIRSIVFVKVPQTEAPTFEAREVVLGSRAGDQYVIESGLSEGEQVVTHGTFKVDAAAQLADKFSMMNRDPGSGTVPVHNHGEVNMDEEASGNQNEEDHSNH